MTRIPLWAAAVAASLPLVASAQEVRILTTPEARGAVVWRGGDRLMLGITTKADSERADTLGLLIDEVREDSPAAKAGLKAGDRLQAINGVNLRADRADAGENDYDGALTRRLTRALDDVKEGDEVELRVYSDGRTRSVKVKPVKQSELYGVRAQALMTAMGGDRAVFGFTVGSTGSPRDTLGVFVSAVTTGGPADKAGIVEGDRIAAINGVSLRVAREDAEDRAVGTAKATRLRREIAKLKAGESAELTVITAGRSRTVRVTSMKASELPGGGFSFYSAPDIAPLMGELERRSAVERLMPSRVMPTPPVPPAAPAAPRAPLVRSRGGTRIITTI